MKQLLQSSQQNKQMTHNGNRNNDKTMTYKSLYAILMTDIYHLLKSDHPSWHRKWRSNDPQVDDEVSFQSPCNDMAISFPGSNSTARPRAWQRSNCPPPGKASIVKCPLQGPKNRVKCPPYAPPPPPPRALHWYMHNLWTQAVQYILESRGIVWFVSSNHICLIVKLNDFTCNIIVSTIGETRTTFTVVPFQLTLKWVNSIRNQYYYCCSWVIPGSSRHAHCPLKGCSRLFGGCVPLSPQTFALNQTRI